MLFTSGGPNVMFGTKCPSITSRWSTVAPASTTFRISSARRPKSAERIDGAMRGLRDDMRDSLRVGGPDRAQAIRSSRSTQRLL